MVRILCSNATAGEDVKNFTVALTDPDAPSKKNREWSEMCHWIVTVPISGSILQEDETNWDEIPEESKEIIECTSFLSFLSFTPISPLTQFRAHNVLTQKRQASGATLQNRLPSLRFCSSGRRQHKPDRAI